MQRELPLVARGAFRQGVEHVNAAAEMRGGFDIGRARDRPLAGAMPVCDCLLAEAGLREVMGEQLRLRLGAVGKAPMPACCAAAGKSFMRTSPRSWKPRLRS